MDRLDVKRRPRDPRSSDGEPEIAVATPRQVEQALLGLAHRLSASGYGVLIWDRPGAVAEPEHEAKA